LLTPGADEPDAGDEVSDDPAGDEVTDDPAGDELDDDPEVGADPAWEFELDEHPVIKTTVSATTATAIRDGRLETQCDMILPLAPAPTIRANDWPTAYHPSGGSDRSALGPCIQVLTHLDGEILQVVYGPRQV
jgi:hypothetical protein